MRATETGLRLLYFVPPLAAAALVPPASGSPALAAAVFVSLLAYARLCAFLSSRRGWAEAILAVELLPFLAWLALRALAMEPSALPAYLAEAVLASAFILAIEGVLAPASRGFALVLAFCAAAAGAGFLMAALPPATVIAASALGLVLLGFLSARRKK